MSFNPQGKVLVFCFLTLALSIQVWSIDFIANYSITKTFFDRSSNKLLLTGNFTSVNGVEVRGALSWDGIRIDSLQGGVDLLNTVSSVGFINTCLNTDSGLIAGGSFMSLGEVPTLGLGIWNQGLWDSFPARLWDRRLLRTISVVANIDSELVVAGRFDSLTDMRVRNVASWNGSAWRSWSFPELSSDSILLDELVVSLVKYGSEVYVAGSLHSKPVDTIRRILRFSAGSWRTVGQGILGLNASISSMNVYHEKLYVAGEFNRSDGNLSENIQVWDGATWQPVGAGVYNANGSWSSVWHMDIINDKLVVSGIFDRVDGQPTWNMATWDGTDWCPVFADGSTRIDHFVQWNDSISLVGPYYDLIDSQVVKARILSMASLMDTCLGVIGIPEPQKSIGLEVYPNPVAGPLRAVFNRPAQVNLQFVLLDVFGRVVRDVSVMSSAKEFEMNLEGLESGIYILKSTVGGQGKRVIKQ